MIESGSSLGSFVMGNSVVQVSRWAAGEEVVFLTLLLVEASSWNRAGRWDQLLHPLDSNEDHGYVEGQW